MARADIKTCFEHTSLPHGDDGRRVPGIVARCGTAGCTTAVALPVNTMSHTGGNDHEVEWRFISRKLEAKDWRIGRRAQDHRCPRCQRNAKLDKPEPSYALVSKSGKQTPGNLRLVKDALMSSTTRIPPAAPPTKTEPARTMTRDDRRIIFEKLNEVYVNEKTGYSNGWSDERVAADLGVPRAWVCTIRDENFGEEITSEVTRKMIVEAKELVATIAKYRAVVENSAKSLVPLFERADKIEKHLAEIAKVMK